MTYKYIFPSVWQSFIHSSKKEVGLVPSWFCTNFSTLASSSDRFLPKPSLSSCKPILTARKMLYNRPVDFYKLITRNGTFRCREDYWRLSLAVGVVCWDRLILHRPQAYNVGRHSLFFIREENLLAECLRSPPKRSHAAITKTFPAGKRGAAFIDVDPSSLCNCFF